MANKKKKSNSNDSDLDNAFNTTKKIEKNEPKRAKPSPKDTSSSETITEDKTQQSGQADNTTQIIETNTEGASSHSSFVKEGESTFGAQQASKQDEEVKRVIESMGGSEANNENDHNPFEGQTIARGPHAEIKTDQNIKEDLKEFFPPPASMLNDKKTTQFEDETKKKEEKDPLNKEMGDLSNKDQRQAAEAMVQFTFDIWKMLKGYSGKLVQIPKEKLLKLHKDLKIDISYPCPVGQNSEGQMEYLPFEQVIETFNVQSQEAFEVSEEFMSKIREPLIREFMRRGIGLTDIQLIAWYSAVEIIQTIATVIALRGVGSEMLKQQMAFHEEILKRGNPAPGPNPTSGPAAEAPKPNPQANGKPSQKEQEYHEVGEVENVTSIQVLDSKIKD